MFREGQRVRHINCDEVCLYLNKALVVYNVLDGGCDCQREDGSGRGYFVNKTLEPIEEES